MNSSIAVNHPLIQHHLTRLRDQTTPPEEFRHLVQRLAVLLAYEATKDLELSAAAVRTPLVEMQGARLRDRIALVPILRAGLGMVDPILDLIPTAEVWHLGLYRDEATAEPVEYYSKLPGERPPQLALVVDPMLATGGSAVSALAALRRWGVPRLKLLSIIAAPEGVALVQGEFPDAEIHVCAVDQQLNSDKYIVPGLGDAGDRTFNTLGH
ncbi:MAG: uracil phosphoribosyltransferase [Planctomycetales bacterium]|nr:uracil phosphoribosyltransferase [Planctomycetales bacterium]